MKKGKQQRLDILKGKKWNCLRLATGAILCHKGRDTMKGVDMLNNNEVRIMGFKECNQVKMREYSANVRFGNLMICKFTK